MDIVALVISILGFAATLFAIGYELGKDIHDHHDKTQK
jgi:4-hydroxybenzoate polyprenyltransferase